MPPPKSVWNAVAKCALMTAKASSNFCRETWSSSRDGLLRVGDRLQQVVALAARGRSKRCSHSLYSSSAIMLTGPMDSMRAFSS